MKIAKDELCQSHTIKLGALLQNLKESAEASSM